MPDRPRVVLGLVVQGEEDGAASSPSGRSSPVSHVVPRRPPRSPATSPTA